MKKYLNNKFKINIKKINFKYLKNKFNKFLKNKI